MLTRGLRNGWACPSPASFVCLRCELRLKASPANRPLDTRLKLARLYSSSPSETSRPAAESAGHKSAGDGKPRDQKLSSEEKEMFEGGRLPPGFLVRRWRRDAKLIHGDKLDWPRYLRQKAKTYNKSRERKHIHATKRTSPEDGKGAASAETDIEVSQIQKGNSAAAKSNHADAKSDEIESGQSKSSHKSSKRGSGKEHKTMEERPPGSQTLKEALLAAGQNTEKKALRDAKMEATLSHSVNVADLTLEAIDIPHPPIAQLSYGLDRVLFNQGVYHLRDPRSRVYNFDPYLEKVIPVDEFDFDTLSTFMTPSSDPDLARIAKEKEKKYVGSTSSMTGVLKHFHFLLSRFRPLNLSVLSKSFPVQSQQMTLMTRAPDAVFLRYRDGAYALDADKQYDSPNVLSLMGKFMEKLLTISKDDFEKHRIGNSHQLDEADRDAPEAFHYSTMGDFVIRSQLDAHDPRLPGQGVFDLKTRAVLPVRMDTKDFEWGTDYEIKQMQGHWNSYEREFHDMARSTLLKYSLQVRLGRMDGIFVAYHNIKRIFGFQYLSLGEMDQVLHGTTDTTLGDRELLLSLHLMNDVFNRAIEQFPKQTIRFHFEARETIEPFLYIFAEPVSDEEANKIQTANKEEIERWEGQVLGRTTASTKVVPLTEDEQPAQVDSQSQTDSVAELDKGDTGTPTDTASAVPIEAPTSSSIESASDASVDSSADTVGISTDATETAADPITNNTASETAEETATAADTQPVTAQESDQTAPSADNGSPLDTSTSGGTKFLDALTAAEEKLDATLPQTPLLAYIMHVKSSSNGAKVTVPPDSMTADDSWQLRYSLNQVTDQRRAWRLYLACKARRSKAYGGDEVVGVPAEDESDDQLVGAAAAAAAAARQAATAATATTSASKHNDHYLNLLRDVTAASRVWREALDARDAGQPIRHWDDKV